jgi:protein-tyrosine-phosphatase
MERWRYPVTLHRRSVALGLLLVAGRAGAKTPCAPPVVLFVCPAGTVKSAIARETLRNRAATAGVLVEAQSRGVHPEDHVSPGLAANLKADGIDPASEPARAFVDADAKRADVVIAFDEAAKVPALSQARVWDIPSWNSDYPAAKAALAARMDDLLAELRARQDAGCAGAGR